MEIRFNNTTFPLVNLHFQLQITGFPSGVYMKALIIQALIPQATAAFVFAQIYDVFPRFIATSLVIGNLLCFPVLVTGFYVLEAIPWLRGEDLVPVSL